jgi:4a-hydroxytetrahydrobiopterin dehydratase
MSLLGDAEVTAELARTPGWKRAGQAIERLYRFRDFREAMVFVNWVAAIAERANHHPDVTIRYNEVTISVWTHSDGGLTSKDFTLARWIDAL